MRKIFVFTLCFVFSVLCHAYHFSIEKFNRAIAEMQQGGLPVIVLNIDSLDLYMKINEKLLKNQSFMEHNGKKFKLFVINSTVLHQAGKSVMELPGKGYGEVYHKDEYNGSGFIIDTVLPENYADYLLTRIKERPQIFKYGSYPEGDIKKVHELVKQGKFSYHTYDRNGTHAFHHFLHYNGLPIPEHILIEMINDMKSKNYSKDFWSKALMIHTGNIGYYGGKYQTWEKITDLLLAEGADPNYADEYGISTAYKLFDLAVGSKLENYLPFFRKLIAAGLDINRCYPNKKYPEQSGCIEYYMPKKDYSDTIIPPEGINPWMANYNTFNTWEEKIYLIDNFKVDINARNGYFLFDVIVNYNVYYYRLGKTKIELLEEMIKRGVNLNVKYGSETPLIRVAKTIRSKGNEEVFYYLLEKGADPNVLYKRKNNYDEEKVDTVFSLLPSKYRADKKIIDALLNKGILPEYLDYSAALACNDEDLALYLVEKGCSILQVNAKKFPRLAEAIKDLPESRIKKDLNSYNKHYLKEFAKMTAQGSCEFEVKILKNIIGLLEKHSSYRSSSKVKFFSTYSDLQSFYHPVYTDRNKTIIDYSFLYNIIFASNEEERFAGYVKAAMAICDSTNEMFNRGVNSYIYSSVDSKDIYIIRVKEQAIFRLGCLLETAAELYKFLPKGNQAALDYLPQHTAVYLKQELDNIPEDYNKKQIQTVIGKIVKKVTKAYWCGISSDCPALNEDINTFWARYYSVIELGFQQFPKTQSRKVRKTAKHNKYPIVNEYSIVRKYVDLDIANETKFNLTHRKYPAGTFEDKIQRYKNTFVGSRRAKENFAELLDFMLTLPTSARLLKILPDDIIFCTGQFAADAQFDSRNLIGLKSVKMELLSSVENKVDVQTALIMELVHEMTHAEQKITVGKKLSAQTKRECWIENKLEEIHPLINQYLVLRELLEKSEYKKVAENMIYSFNYPTDHIFKEYNRFWDEERWRNEVVKLFWTNGRKYPYRSKIREDVQSWFKAYERNLQFQDIDALKRKGGISIDQFLEKYQKMMQTSIDKDYFMNTDPVFFHEEDVEFYKKRKK